MSALASLIAFPVAVLTLAAALRSPFARRLVKTSARERWTDRPTPLLGGPAILAGLLVAAGLAVVTGALDPTRELGGILAGCTLVFLVGLVDDLRGLPPLAKIAGQAAAAGIVVASGLSVQVVSNDVLADVMAIVWLVAITNAFNLLDNIDGLAATLAAIAAGYFAIDAVTEHPSHTTLLVALALALGCAAFLPFNLRPGRPAAAFLGDSGSHLLGFGLASLGLASSWKAAGTGVAAIFLPILVLALPILDTALVTLVRLLEGRPIYRGGRDHTSHRLVYRGLSEKRAVALLAFVATAVGGTSLVYTIFGNAAVTAIGVLVTFAALVQFGAFLGDVERDAAARRTAFTLRTRRLLEVVVDAALITAAFTAAYLLLIGGAGTPFQRSLFLYSLPAVLAARFAAFVAFGLYRGVWRYAGAREATAVVVSVALSDAVAFAFIAATQVWGDFPRSVFAVDALICIPLVIASRFAERALFRTMSTLSGRSGRRRTLIVGAGRSGRSLMRELRETPGEHVVGFVDDDPLLQRRRLQGVPVLGRLEEIGRSVGMAQPDVVLVTIPDAPRERLDPVIEACGRAQVPCRFVRRELDVDPRSVLEATAK